MSENTKQKFAEPNVEEVKTPETDAKKTETKTVETTKEAPKATAEPKKEEKKSVKPEATVEKKEAKAKPVVTPKEEKKVTEIKAGVKVTLKPETVTTVTGTPIPAFAHKNTYVVKKVLPSRVIIGVETLEYAVKEEDLVLN